MLMKLLKYDMKFSYRIMLFVYIVSIALSVFLSATLLLSQTVEYVSIFSLISFLPYMFSLFAIALSGFLIVAVRVYKNLYTDEGYLTFTLPVTSSQIIWSKVLLYGFWQIAGIIVLLVSIALPILTLAYSQGVGEIVGVIELMIDYFSFIARTVLNLDAKSIALFFIILFVDFVVMLISTPVAIVFSFSVGQLTNRYRLLATFGVYYVYNLIMNTILSVIESIFITGEFLLAPETGINFSVTSFAQASLISLIIDIVVVVATFLISRHIMTKKLNLM